MLSWKYTNLYFQTIVSISRICQHIIKEASVTPVQCPRTPVLQKQKYWNLDNGIFSRNSFRNRLIQALALAKHQHTHPHTLNNINQLNDVLHTNIKQPNRMYKCIRQSNIKYLLIKLCVYTKSNNLAHLPYSTIQYKYEDVEGQTLDRQCHYTYDKQWEGSTLEKYKDKHVFA